MSLPLKWELPGGKPESGEELVECLIRETEEELGYIVKVLTQLEPVDHVFNGKNYRMVPFLCELSSGELVISEHKTAQWIPIHEWEQFDWAPTERIIIGNWIKEFHSIPPILFSASKPLLA